MNINNAFPSKYIKSGDIPEGTDLVLTVKSVVQEEVGQGEDLELKPIVYFTEQDKGLVLNKTNADAIAKLYGPETDGWIGKRLGLFATEVDFKGKQTLALRVRLKAPAAGAVAHELWTFAQAKGELEKNGLTTDALKAALKAANRPTNAEGQIVYVASRDTELVRQLIADALAGPIPF